MRIAAFKPKWAMGRSGDRTDRFIISYRESETMSLKDFLLRISQHIPKDRYLPECAHNR